MNIWTAEEVAKFLKVSKKLVYRQAQLGNIPCIKSIGRKIRFVDTAIYEWASNEGGSKWHKATSGKFD